MNYLKWLGTELKSINAAGGVMLAFIIGVQLAFYLSAPITGLSTITLVATLVGSACTVYMMIGKPINGLLGLISAIGFIYINWTAGHYASVLDQLVFVALIDLPLIFTWKTWGHKVENGVKFLSKTGWVLTLAFMLAFWYPMMLAYEALGDSNPLWDSIVLIIGATASLYVFKGYGDSYTLWLLSDFVNIALWVSALFAGYSASSLPMLLTMSFYLATAVYGRFFSIWKGRKNTNSIKSVR
ncbi:nicotinamide riboside transporter PnuC [Weissella thailandensis]|uniref:Nicotinamide riboside transporter PnuC n=2 Tax=Weissella thailandensis TaxID=89061 RepID=A0ABX9I6B3_9LACO|nr:nicotinamide riboside transporter PnuC [Weissella thailandensis]RDS59650.1 nicotinamide riboside transporter PnuC [Weissella thailandensis]GEP75480.1 nicotinamide mononucleotide transporter [Weissella thailandensis]